MSTDDRLRGELLEMFRKDQETPRESIKVALQNSARLKEVITEHGWPTEERVGTDGELAAWLIVQHSDEIEWQEEVLAILKSLPPTADRNIHIAYLEDRILVNKGLPQTYGTQFRYGEPLPIQDPGQVDSRRKAMNLEPLSNYREAMRNERSESRLPPWRKSKGERQRGSSRS